MKKYLIIFIIIIILVIATFYPGLKREKALIALNSERYIAEQHVDSKVLDQDLHITPIPFGGLVSTYEGMWCITFWGKVISI